MVLSCSLRLVDNCMKIRAIGYALRRCAQANQMSLGNKPFSTLYFTVLISSHLLDGRGREKKIFSQSQNRHLSMLISVYPTVIMWKKAQMLKGANTTFSVTLDNFQQSYLEGTSTSQPLFRPQTQLSTRFFTSIIGSKFSGTTQLSVIPTEQEVKGSTDVCFLPAPCMPLSLKNQGMLELSQQIAVPASRALWAEGREK